MTLDLRPYQEEALAACVEKYRAGARRVVLVLPTGTGKTRTATVATARHRGERVLWVAPRDELVRQGAKTLRAAGLDVGVVAASSHEDERPDAPVVVASVQTLIRRPPIPISFGVIDECHTTGLAASWQAFLARYKVPLLGLTATPCRGDGQGMAPAFDGMVVGISDKEATEQGFLVPLDMRHPDQYIPGDKIAECPVKAYVAHAEERPAILFASNTKAAQEFTLRFQRAKIPAGYLDGETPSRERERILDRYRAGELRVLCNVQILTEGTDLPECKCVMLARNVGHMGLFVQMTGRSRRPLAGSRWRTARLIDLKGVVHNHGRPDQEMEYSLDGEGMRAKNRPLKGEAYCLLCGVPVEKSSAVCSACGRERPEMVVPRAVGRKLIYWERLKRVPDERRIEMLAQWISEARSKNWKPGQPFVKFKMTFGCAPTKTMVTIAMAKSRDSE